MKHKIIVPDANVAVKILHAESDTEQARALFRSCAEHGTKILVPEHFLYEVVNVCQRVKVGVDDALDFYEALRSSILTVASPNRSTWQRAEKIAQDGHPSSGFPSIYDSIYQALALDAGGVFITADKRHVAKAHQHGGVMLLSDWTDEK